MAPSQLKQLKAHLHDKRTAKNPKAHPPKSQRDGRALASRASTFKTGRTTQSSTLRSQDPKARADSLRRATLLPALQNRHKVGGIVDRRIGENDPTMSPEERMLQRYAKQRSRKDVFNLEGGDDEEEEGGLTHGGRSVMDLEADDFEAESEGDMSSGDDGEMMVRKKRRRSDVSGEEEVAAAGEGEPERKKSRKEVMQEVIAKSKLHKYERQKAKDEDDDIREELDKGMGDLLAALRGGPRLPAQALQAQKPASMEIHPDRLAQMNGEARAVVSQPRPEDLPPTPPEDDIRPPPPPTLDRKQQAEKDYDQRLRQMAQDQRAQPTQRSKTAEEKAAEEASKLREAEAQRQRRMRGDDEDSGDEREEAESAYGEDENIDGNEATQFGFQTGSRSKNHTLDVEDEDDFLIDEDLVASGSEIDSDFSDAASDQQGENDEEDDSEFLKDVLPDGGITISKADLAAKTSQLPFTYPCPRTHEELLQVLKDISTTELPLVIQRIRALYHPQLAIENKDKLSQFASTLVDHLHHVGTCKPAVPLEVIEQLIRHTHSLAKSYPDATLRTFRQHLSHLHEGYA